MTEVIAALESSLYPKASGSFSQDDLEDEWSGLDLVQNARVVRDGERVLAYGAVRDRGELWRVEGYVHPDAHGRGIGKLLATELEREAADRGARRSRTASTKRTPPPAACSSRSAMARCASFARCVSTSTRRRRCRCGLMGWTVGAFDPDRDALMFHAAQEEAFADHLEHIPRNLEWWSKSHLRSGRFDPALWCVVRAGDEIAAGTICTADTYGGGFVQILFTRRPWRKQGIGKALLADTFRRLWERGERNVGLGVDAASDTGAFRLYERAGMTPRLGWVMYEKEVAAATTARRPAT